jgi:hypothetical protein
MEEKKIDTMNNFLVSIQRNCYAKDGVKDNNVIGRFAYPILMSRKDAINLAAWLVTLATDDPDKDFTPHLSAVQQIIQPKAHRTNIS